MRTLTIIEPWATLISLGAKRFETRAWAADFCGPLAIHAGKNRDFARDYLRLDPYRSVLAASTAEIFCLSE